VNAHRPGHGPELARRIEETIAELSTHDHHHRDRIFAAPTDDRTDGYVHGRFG
jgi:hypothetical protein